MVTRSQYATDANRASYYWMAENGSGITIAQEHDSSGNDVPLRVLGFVLQDHEGPYHGAFLSERDTTLRIHAVSYRIADRPSYFIDIGTYHPGYARRSYVHKMGRHGVRNG